MDNFSRPFRHLFDLTINLGLSVALGINLLTHTLPLPSIVETSQAAGLAEEFGVVGAVPSLNSDSSKQTAIDKIANAGFGWMRHEFDINISGFEQYDAAHSKAKAKGIKTLGLLLFTGGDKGHDYWKSYVQKVVSHFGADIPAWEIMNEADNYLSASDYVSYLKEAHEIIKGINAGATVVLTGITSRPETTSFWDGVAAAGGWGYFDVAGLHVYHSGNPEKVNFGGGDTSAEFDRTVAGLKKHGSKKIWITEMGYKTSEVGNDNQANYLARTLILARANSHIEKAFVYRLYDDGKATYGLMGSDLVERPSYNAVKTLISYLGGAGYGIRLYPASQQVLDSLENTNGWSTKATSNGSTDLSAVPGKTGNGMKIAYSFTADKAYSIAEKSLPVNGKPEAFAAWFYGDATKNVWKFRYKDAKGETFQTDLGNIGAEWTYRQFTIEKDDAWVSWDGDGVIDYPISFNSFVIDRQGGDASANGIVDELVAITGGADLFAYQFGSTVAYWKVSGTASVDLCGAKRNFSETPSYATGVNCTGTAKTSTTTTTQTKTTTKATPTPKPKVTPKPLPVVDKTKSVFRVDGVDIPADGQSSYQIVMLFKDASGAIIKSLRPQLSVNPAVEGAAIAAPVLVGDEWMAHVTSTTAGEVKVKITVSGGEVTTLPMTFTALPTPLPSPTLTPVPVVSKPKSRLPLVLGVIGGVGLAGLASYLSYVYYFRRKKRLL